MLKLFKVSYTYSLATFLAFPIIFCTPQAYSELNTFLGSGVSHTWGHRGLLKPSIKPMVRSGINYEFGQITFLWIHGGVSLSRFQIEWEGQSSLNHWTYYLAGIHLGLSLPLLPSPNWGNRIGVTLNSKWIPRFIIHDKDQQYVVKNINQNGLTDLDLYFRQDFKYFYLRPYYIYPISQLIPQGGLKVGSYGLDFVFPLLKRK